VGNNPYAPQDVLIEVGYCGICGSDVHKWKDSDKKGVSSPTSAVVTGHEIVGTVKAVGPEIADTPWRNGRRPSTWPLRAPTRCAWRSIRACKNERCSAVQGFPPLRRSPESCGPADSGVHERSRYRTSWMRPKSHGLQVFLQPVFGFAA
jgi:NADPH:quinone reductase-like Zn-dependent oxidoreductase